MLMGRYQAAAEVSYAERKRTCVYCETRGRNRSAVLLADFLFPAVQQCIVSPTHIFIPKALHLKKKKNFPHTLPDQSLPPHLLKPTSPTHTHTQLYCSLQLPSDETSEFIFEVPSTLFLPHGNPSSSLTSSRTLMFTMGGFERVVGCLHQIIGESRKINHKQTNCGGIRSMPPRCQPFCRSLHSVKTLSESPPQDAEQWWSTCSSYILLQERPCRLFRLFIITKS